MKARSAGIRLYHIEPGHHRATCLWHDSDHKAEVIGTMPHVYLSQRWVTPQEWMPLRPPSDLPFGGGEYVNVYWSSGTPGEMNADFQALGARLTPAGRMGPVDEKKMVKVWPAASGAALYPTLVAGGSDLRVSAEAMTASVVSTGLITVVEEIRDPDDRAAFDRWHEADHIPAVLESTPFSAAAKFRCDHPELGAMQLTLFYTDRPAPDEAYREYSAFNAEWRDRNPAPGGGSHRVVFESISCPSIGQYDIYE